MAGNKKQINWSFAVLREVFFEGKRASCVRLMFLPFITLKDAELCFVVSMCESRRKKVLHLLLKLESFDAGVAADWVDFFRKVVFK